MVNILSQVYNQLPSPPLSPSPLPLSSLPLSPSTKICNEDFDSENEENDDEFDFTEKEIKYLESVLGFPIEFPIKQTIEEEEPSKEEILRNKYMYLMEEGVEMNGEMTPYSYAVEKLHSIGGQVINKRTLDAVPLRVYETGKDSYQEFWVHPLFLSLHSFQFFKLFEEIKENKEEENEEEVIEIEVPSLETFAFILYWIYTGDNTKLLENAKLNEIFCKGVMENIECLEINMVAF